MMSSAERMDDMSLMKSLGDEHVDILGNGKLLKKVLRLGDPKKGIPTPGSTVYVHYRGTLIRDGSQFDSSYDRNDYFKFRIGVGQVIKGWDEGVATMHVGEKAMLTCAPDYAYGARGHPPVIPENAVLQFEVELVKFEEENVPKTVEEKIAEASSRKELGNLAFVAADYVAAVDHYSGGLDLVLPLYDVSEEEADKINATKLPLHLNAAAAHIKLQNFEEAIKHCEKAIIIEPMHVKAHFRRGTAYLGKNRFDLALKDFEKAIEIDPNNTEAARMRDLVIKKNEEYKRKEKDMYKKIFAEKK